MPLNLQLLLAQRQRLSTGHAQLPLDQIESSDGFGHRVFHLQAGVHFHEEKLHRVRLVISCLFDNELDRAGAHIVHRLGRGHRCGPHLGTQGVGHAGGWCFFQHFLVASLHRTVALKQIHAVAVRVAKNLNLDVAWALHILFNQHRIAAKTVARFALATGQGSGKVL